MPQPHPLAFQTQELRGLRIRSRPSVRLKRLLIVRHPAAAPSPPGVCCVVRVLRSAPADDSGGRTVKCAPALKGTNFTVRRDAGERTSLRPTTPHTRQPHCDRLPHTQDSLIATDYPTHKTASLRPTTPHTRQPHCDRLPHTQDSLIATDYPTHKTAFGFLVVVTDL